MNTTEKSPEIIPVRLGPESKFRFQCHNGLKCFTKCCRGINIVLTPYDILRMKKRLGLSSEDFLAIYTAPQLLEKTDLPMATLKLLDDDRKSCPFVRDDGCIIYEDRPTACRYYPLGSASLSHKEGADANDFYFFVHEPHCLGFEETREWTVREWRKDQGVDIHDEINAQWTDLIVRKRSFPPSIKLTDKSKQLFFMVSYNIDPFRRFVFESPFLNRFEVDEQTRKEISADEIKLLQYGLSWLKDTFFQNKELDAHIL